MHADFARPAEREIKAKSFVCACLALVFVCLGLLRVEFLLKTESGYLRDAEVTLFTLANP